MKARLTFYGGVNEIGGNKFLLEDEDTRLFLDFGRNFAREKKFFDEPWLSPRSPRQLMALGILPGMRGPYRQDESHFDLNGVLISHPHTDHFDSIRWLKDDYPIFASETAMDLILAREFSTRGGPSAEYRIAAFTKEGGKKVFKTFLSLPIGRDTTAPGLPVIAYPVDHSVPGACGLVIETSSGNIVYTGDLRVHGKRQVDTQRFIEASREAEPEVLIIEGTHIDSGHVESEGEVMRKAKEIVERTRGLVLTSFATADMDRLSTFYDVAKATNRKLVLSAKQAFILKSLVEKKLIYGPALDSENILIFQRAKKLGSPYEEELADAFEDKIVAASDVNKSQSELILVAGLSDMGELPDIDPVAGSCYILSSSEPVDEEAEISFDKLLAWLTHYGIPMFQVHSSGHANPHDLRDMIERIAPRSVFLIHTQRPDLFKRFLSRMGFSPETPIEGQRYEI